MPKIKHLVVSGCSFTNDEYCDTWSTFLKKELGPDVGYSNYAKVSAGNGYISSSLIYGISKALKKYKSDELLVGVMWSGMGRSQTYQSYPNTFDFNGEGAANPVGFVDSQPNNWILMNGHWKDDLSTTYYRLFYDERGSFIYSYENILKVQWFLKNLGIKYFMTNFAPGGVKPIVDPQTTYLYDLIDKDHFLPVKSCMEWCVFDSGIKGSEKDEKFDLWVRHPTPPQHESFTKNVVIPHLKNKGYI